MFSFPFVFLWIAVYFYMFRSSCSHAHIFDDVRNANFWNLYLTLAFNPNGALVEDLALHQTPLHMASYYGYSTIVMLFLENESPYLSYANSTIRDIHRQTPLHLACSNGHQEIVAIFLERAIELERYNPLELVNAYQHTPLHLAVMWGHAGVVRLALQHELKVRSRVGRMSDLALFELSIDAPDSEEHTSLHLAVMYNEPAVVEVLLRFGADVSAVDRVGWSPLHIAALRGYEEIVRLIVHYVAYSEHYVTPVYATFPDSKSAPTSLNFMHARALTPLPRPSVNVQRVAQLINSKNMYGASTVHMACMYQHLETALTLVRYGGNIHQADNDGLNPLAFVKSSHDRLRIVDAANQQFQFLSEFREKNQPELFLTYNHIWSMYNPYDYEYDRMHSSERGDGSVVSAYSLHSSETDIIEYDRNLSAEISSLFTLLGIKSESEAELEKEMDMNIVDVPGGAPHATDAFSHVLKLERNVCKSNVRKLVQLLKEQHVRKLTYNCRQLLNHS